MRVVLDCRFWSVSGLGRYTRELVAAMEPLTRPQDEFHVVLLPWEADMWTPSRREWSRAVADAPPFSRAEQTVLPRVLRRLAPDLVHFLSFNAPLAWRGAFVATVHDLTFFDYRNVRGPGDLIPSVVRYAIGRAVARRTIARARQLIVPSEFVRRDLMGRFRRPSVVVPQGVASPAPEAEAVPDVELPFVLHVGNVFPHKNAGILVDAAAACGVRVVFAGPDDWFRDRLASDVLTRGLRRLVTFAGRVSDPQLEWLYRHASAVVVPSTTEGFGLPILEAMARGTPVVASTGGAVPEVGGNAVVSFDPTDAEDLITALRRVLDDGSLRERLAREGAARAAAFSWARTARSTLDVYRMAAGG